jgi:hypothetical protein
MTLTPVGPTPYVVGFACRESRREMEVVMPKPLRTRADGRFFWIRWDTTVLHLGQYGNARRFIQVLDLHEQARFRHVAAEHVWGDMLNLESFSRDLAYASHGLRTLVVHIRAIDDADDPLGLRNCPVTRVPSWEVEPQLTPSATTAALYTARSISDTTRPEISEVRLVQQPDRQMGWNTTRRRIARYPFIEADWDDSEIPKVHLLHLDPAQY